MHIVIQLIEKYEELLCYKFIYGIDARTTCIITIGTKKSLITFSHQINRSVFAQKLSEIQLGQVTCIPPIWW